uniref:Uncharacterized protein n=1 Tax=Pipistrellus kuhlii TaxID=59472 RepID=A0A7J7TLT0_PIPKU|nr:hypothetical protein mPipKuh1_009334 [Pipistrellus kuhlii]
MLPRHHLFLFLPSSQVSTAAVQQLLSLMMGGLSLCTRSQRELPAARRKPRLIHREARPQRVCLLLVSLRPWPSLRPSLSECEGPCSISSLGSLSVKVVISSQSTKEERYVNRKTLNFEDLLDDIYTC